MISDQCKKEYFSKVFTELLNQWKREHNKSQADFADIIGAHPNSISRYKKARDFPNESTLGAIAKEFGVSIDVFYPNTDIEKFIYDSRFFDKIAKAWSTRYIDAFEKYGIKYTFFEFLEYSTFHFGVFDFECGPLTEQLWLNPNTNDYVKPDNASLQAYVMTTFSQYGYCDMSISANANTKQVQLVAVDPATLNGYMLGFTHNDLINIKDMQEKTTEYLQLLNVKKRIENHTDLSIFKIAGKE